jgi:CHAT domain-containing protein
VELSLLRQRAVGRDTVLLWFAMEDEQSALWLATSETLARFDLPGRPALEALARQVHRLASQSRRLGAAGQTAIALEHASDVLLGPAAGMLAGSRRLVIVADGALRLVPFAALPAPHLTSTRAPGLQTPEARESLPLLTEHEIVQLSSARIPSLLRASPAVSPRARADQGLLAVVAAPVLRAGDPRLGGRGSASPDLGEGRHERDGRALSVPGTFEEPTLQLGELPYAAHEARAILDLAAGSRNLMATGFAASRELVLSGALAEYRILHFATHGLVEQGEQGGAALVLSRFDEAGRPRDALLRSRDVLDLALTADLVVLSACSSPANRGAAWSGEELSEAFLSAGAARVLASLWAVDDQAGAELMRHFYRGLLHRGLAPAAALREAQLALRAVPRWRPPFYWAGLVLQGDPL